MLPTGRDRLRVDGVGIVSSGDELRASAVALNLSFFDIRVSFFPGRVPTDLVSKVAGIYI